jgi:transcriptional regulator with XRE-family HTH domain
MIAYHRAMSIGPSLQAWRLSRRLSIETLSTQSGLPETLLASMEAGEQDPTVSALRTLAAVFGVPVSWLFTDPSQINLLTTDGDDDQIRSDIQSPDPVIDQILAACRDDRTLFVLLTALLQSGEPKLLTAAEASLRSLVKQARRSSVPWQSRPSGHFEPPSD